MKVSTLILLASLSNFVFGCAETQKKSLLEERADYGINAPPLDLKDSKGGSVQYVPTRVPERVAIAWLHQHELPSKDYFWGSWLSVIVVQEGWQVVKVPRTKRAPDNPKPKDQSRSKRASALRKPGT